MAYGVYLKNINTNETIFDGSLMFHPAERSGISTSDTYFFHTTGFTATQMSVNFAQHGNLIGIASVPAYSQINFDLNQFNFYGIGANMEKPTVVEICTIDAYEIGLANTVYSSNISVGQKCIKNYSDPHKIFEIQDVSPLSITESDFADILKEHYLKPAVGVESFCYVKFDDSNITKFFLAFPDSGNIAWYELPDEVFFHEADYSLTNVWNDFNGSSLPLSVFQGIVPKVNETILVDNAFLDDTLSGLYTISALKDTVVLDGSALSYNHVGQIFNIKKNLDISNSMAHYPAVYYVPYEYGQSDKPFAKNLQLKAFTGNDSSIDDYPPLMKDEHSESKLILYLNEQYMFTKRSDAFKTGIAVSNWCDDSILFGVGFNYEIKEGY